MHVIAGVTGRVGSATASRLLDDGVPVRVLVRRASAARPWVERGAEAAVLDLTDRRRLTAALDGAAGFFTLLPFDPRTTDFAADMAALTASMAGAVADSGVPHVVVLSSAGADLASGTGPIVPLHHLERALRSTRAVVTALRSVHFQEKVCDVLGVARGEGIYPVFGESVDVPVPMVATRDVGAAAARALRTPPRRSEVVDVAGPLVTEREVAEALGRALARRLEVVALPRAAWPDALRGAGMSSGVADVLVGLHDAAERGLLVPRGDRTVHGRTRLEETLATLVGVAA